MKFPIVLASFTLALSQVVSATPTPVRPEIEKRAAPVDQLVGYATLNGGTTGGAGGTTTTVTTLAALRAAVAGTSPKIVIVDGIIKGDGELIDIGSNTSVLGKSGGSVNGLTGSGFRIKRSVNVIVRNLKLSLSKAPVDLISIQNESKNIWIDHNEFSNDLVSGKDYYDGALDISHASDFVTISWNNFHDTFKTSLVGHSNKNGAEDTGHLRVTYHHNWFHNVGSRLPSLRFGTGHVYNNYYSDVKTGGVDSRLGAQVLLENNYFVNVANPVMTTEEGGFVNPSGNIFVTSGVPDFTQVGTFTTAPYTVTLDEAADVPAIVQAAAGLAPSIAF